VVFSLAIARSERHPIGQRFCDEEDPRGCTGFGCGREPFPTGKKKQQISVERQRKKAQEQLLGFNYSWPILFALILMSSF
jgi:hypothetical protein